MTLSIGSKSEDTPWGKIYIDFSVSEEFPRERIPALTSFLLKDEKGADRNWVETGESSVQVPVLIVTKVSKVYEHDAYTGTLSIRQEMPAGFPAPDGVEIVTHIRTTTALGSEWRDLLARLAGEIYGTALAALVSYQWAWVRHRAADAIMNRTGAAWIRRTEWSHVERGSDDDVRTG